MPRSPCGLAACAQALDASLVSGAGLTIFSFAGGAPKHRSERADAPPQSGRPVSFVKKAFVKSYGCQMNVYDADRMTDILGHEGFEEPAPLEDADRVVLTTCHIREKAAEKVYSELGPVRRIKRARAAAGRQT